jgi:hypothetical protein
MRQLKGNREREREKERERERESEVRKRDVIYRKFLHTSH